VPQYDALDPDFTVFENLMVFGRYFGLHGDKLRERAELLLSFAQLVNRRNDSVATLSGGMRRRLMLARALINQPKVLFLDEPTTGLDPQAKHVIWDRLVDLKRQGMAMFLTTHYMDEAERCHRLGYIAYGRLLATGTPSELVRQSGLHTWRVSGDDVSLLAKELEQQPGVELVTRFGNALHVCGRNASLLASAIAAYRHDPDLRWHEAAPQLEDVFIHLMQQSADNYAPA